MLEWEAGCTPAQMTFVAKVYDAKFASMFSEMKGLSSNAPVGCNEEMLWGWHSSSCR